MPAILYYGGFVLPDKNAAAQRVSANGKLFEMSNYTVFYLGTADFDQPFDGIRSVSDMKNGYYESHPVGATEWMKRVAYPVNLFTLAEKIPDLVGIVLYNVPYLTAWAVKRFCKKKKITMLFDCTEWSGYTEGNIAKRSFKKVDAVATRYLLPTQVQHIITISKLMEQQYQKRANVLRLPPLVNTELPIWHQEKLRDEKFTFCFIGTVGGNKESLDIVVTAYQKFEKKNMQLRIVGMTQVEFEKEYPMVLSGNRNIHFMGRMSHEKAIQYMQSCDCFLFLRPSDIRNNAGFPTKFAESYTCGVSIITTNVSDVADYMLDSENGFILNDLTEQGILTAMEMVYQQGKKEVSLRKVFDYRNYHTDFDEWMKRTIHE